MTKKEKINVPSGAVVKNCTFQNAIQWDGQAVESIQTVALALLENAKAAHALAAVFASQNIRIEPMIVIGQVESE